MTDNLKNFNFKQILQSIKAFVFDIDGVLSSSVININQNGNLYRTINTRDSYILKQSLNNNIHIGIISENDADGLKDYYEKLGINFISVNSADKLNCIEKFITSLKLEYNEVLYMGDDFSDYEILKRVGLPCCPIDAMNEIREICQYVSKYEGGKGCVRDIVEQVLRVKKYRI